MNSNELRKLFLGFFEERGHTIRPSASLIPSDPSLLFTVAGMVPFKDYFQGKVTLPYTRAASSQKCIRTNDIEQVGKTRRHHTFFEMLGNFSFGDYFKEDAIRWAWEFLTDVVKLPKDKLYITIYKDDDEAAGIWKNKMKIPEDRIFRLGKATNFWEMGPVGPCGYCSEIYFDLEGGETAKVTAHDIENNDDRFLEVWNLVFTQFDKKEDGTMSELKQKNIDTGMGLERLAAVSQRVYSNFETDLFMPIIKDVSDKSGVAYKKEKKSDVSLRVVADHARLVVFLTGDGILPSNEGRGYVLRRLIRRAVRHGRLLGLDETFLYKVVPVVVKAMADGYPELVRRKEYITQIIKTEEDKFQETMDKGIAILDEEIKKLKNAGAGAFPGETAFKLYDTFGFPVEITEEILTEAGLKLDMDKFNEFMERQREQAKKAWQGVNVEAMKFIPEELINRLAKTEFTGYEVFSEDKCKVLAIVKDSKEINEANEGQEVFIVLDKTPFYGESGGQIGDTGYFSNENARVEIIDTQKAEDIFLHRAKIVKGKISKQDTVKGEVDKERRKAIMKNHTGTHLLQAALRGILGQHVEQAGSYVGPDRLRFDFTHFAAISGPEIRDIEHTVNKWVQESLPVNVKVMNVEEAKQTGAMALFEEKYKGRVRVISVDDISKELCAGTHLKNIGEIGLFKIISSGSTAAGIRRIEALTGENAYNLTVQHEDFIGHLKEMFKLGEVSELKDRVEKMFSDFKNLEKKIGEISKNNILREADSFVSKAEEVDGVKLVNLKFENIDSKVTRELADILKSKLKKGVVFISVVKDDRVSFLCGVTNDLIDRIDASKIVKEIASVCEGGGGGRKDLAEAGGKNVSKLDAALKQLPSLIKAKT